MREMSGEHEFYTPEEREALGRLGTDRTLRPELEDRIVGILRRRGLVETREKVRHGPRFRGVLVAFLRPALVGTAVVGAFFLGRALEGEREAPPRALVSVPGAEVPGLSGTVARDDANDPILDEGFDGVPQRLVVLADENRQYEYYVDEKGQHYYVLVKLPIPSPISPPAVESRAAGATSDPRAQSVPGRSNNRFEYYFDTHGNAYGVIARDHSTVDLFATR